MGFTLLCMAESTVMTQDWPMEDAEEAQYHDPLMTMMQQLEMPNALAIQESPICVYGMESIYLIEMIYNPYVTSTEFQEKVMILT